MHGTYRGIVATAFLLGDRVTHAVTAEEVMRFRGIGWSNTSFLEFQASVPASAFTTPVE